MVDRQYRDELLAASYEAVKLELENSEKDLAQLQERAEKLRAAEAALSELLPARDQARRNETPAFLRHNRSSDELEEARTPPRYPMPEVTRASA